MGVRDQRPDLSQQIHTSVALTAQVLRLAREHLGMDAVCLSDFTAGEQLIRSCDADPTRVPFHPGWRLPLAGSYSHHILEGLLPPVIPDTAQHPVASRLPVTRELRIRAFLGAPVTDAGGRARGMLVAMSTRPRPDLGTRDERFLSLLAQQISTQDDEVDACHDVVEAREARLQRMLRGQHLTPVFQAVVSPRSGRLAGVEALTRFTDLTFDPAGWFQEAHALGSGVELEVLALQQALASIDELPPRAWLSVNLSPTAVLDRGASAAILASQPHRIVVEITEHAVVEDYSGLLRAVQPLRHRGVRLAVDDAGAGFASLRHILRLRPDFIKLDTYLTRGLGTDPAHRALVESLTRFSDDTGATVIAEGVESQDELDALVEIGVPLAQGYHLARPAALPLPDRDPCRGPTDLVCPGP